MMVRSILFPAALPEIFTGLRVGFALTLIGTLLGEMFAAQRGLGYLLMTAIGLHNVDLIMAVTFCSSCSRPASAPSCSRSTAGCIFGNDRHAARVRAGLAPSLRRRGERYVRRLGFLVGGT